MMTVKSFSITYQHSYPVGESAHCYTYNGLVVRKTWTEKAPTGLATATCSAFLLVCC